MQIKRVVILPATVQIEDVIVAQYKVYLQDYFEVYKERGLVAIKYVNPRDLWDVAYQVGKTNAQQIKPEANENNNQQQGIETPL
jgi:hypothetical protein